MNSWFLPVIKLKLGLATVAKAVEEVSGYLTMAW
jgi:hypothetical protein